MIKFLIKFASFVACAGILAFGGYQTVQEIKIDEMIGEIETALENTPTFPEFNNPGDNEGGENAGSGNNKPDDNGGSKPGEGNGNTGDISGDIGDIGGGDIGGDIGGEGDQPGNDPTDPEQGENGGSMGDNDNPTDPNPNPDQGGNSGSAGGNEGSNDPTPDEPVEDPETPPTNESLSTDAAQEALGNLYDNSDPEFNDMNREFFVGMIEGFLGGNNNNSNPEPDPDEPPVDEPDFDESFDDDFGADFNPDEFEPEDEEESEEDAVQSEVNDLIIDVAGTYFDNLQAGIQQNQQANAGATEEEQQAARDEFIQQESEAFAGLINIATRPEETTEEQLVQSVDAVLNSSVCLDTVAQSVEKNENLSSTVQDATVNMNEETKAEIETKINEALEANPEKEQQYKDLANLFGITLGAGTTPEIPEGFNPDDYLGNN